MKSRHRWKFSVVMVSLLELCLLVFGLITSSSGQGTMQQLTSGQSILPGGFQPFSPITQNFFIPRSSSRVGTASSSLHNSHFGFVAQERANFPRPTFIGLGVPPRPSPSSPSQVQAPSAKGGEVQYEYYDEPEEEIIYQYGTDVNDNTKPRTHTPTSSVVGKGLTVGDRSRFHVQPQSFTTANLGAKSTLRPSQGFLRETVPVQKFIAFDEPEQPLLLNGRSVQPSRGGNNNINVRPPPGLLRSTAPSSATTTTSTTIRSTTDRSNVIGTRTKNNNANVRKPPLTPARSTFSSSTPRSNEIVQTSSSSYISDLGSVTPSSIGGKRTVEEKRKQKEKRVLNQRNPGSGSNEDYTVEYIEYPLTPEEAGTGAGAKGSFDYYEVSEETAKFILEQQGKSQEKQSATSVSKSSSVSSSVPTPRPKIATTTTTARPAEKKAKVIVSVSTTKTISGSDGKVAMVSPTPALVLAKNTTALETTPVASRPVPSPTLTPDLVSSGAETSPEYYEEEYAYNENPHKSTSTSVSSSSSDLGPSSEVRHDESEEGQRETEEEEQVDEVILKHPQPRKLPSKKDQIPHSHFETLVDFGDLESDQRIPTVGNNEQEQESEGVIAPSITTTTTTTTTTRKPLTTTSRTTKAPKIFGGIKFAEVSADLLPPGFKMPPKDIGTTTSTTTTKPTTSKPKGAGGNDQIAFEEIPSFLLPKGYKPLPVQAAEPTTSTTTPSPKPIPKAGIPFGSIPLNLLPNGYKPPAETETTPGPTEPKNPLDAILSKVKFQEITVPGLIPKDYKKPTEEIPAHLLPPGYKPPATEIPASLLPPGYKPGSGSGPAPTEKSKGPVFPTRPPSNGGLIFPTKPGGFRVTRPTTTEGPKGDTPPPPKVAIAGGWPQRKTTEFTGWPTPLTTPMPPTSSTTTSTTTTEKPTTTTSRSTTTTPPPKRSPLGICPHDICRLEATIRVTGGIKWKPEFADINTEEYKHLELQIRRELDGAYRASGLAPWYKRVQIEGFNQGSVLVDYFVELEGVDRELTTSDVVKVFHKSLLDSDPGDELPQETEAPGALRFGRFHVDPRYTDFKVVNSKTGKATAQPEPLIPQWGIAVIVIGIVSLLFLLILGVIVLVSRYKNSKKKNTVSLTQEMLNEFNKTHMAVSGGVDNYGADDLYNMDDVWNDKQMDRTFDRRPTKRSQGSYKGSGNYNIYDSWKTEWNGYYHNGNYYGDSGYAPSRRRSDYDTNF